MTRAASLPVGVVTPTWNSGAVIEACLTAIVAERVDELVVVDNGSTDDTLAKVAAAAPEARVISLDENRGFAAACNLGAHHTRAPFILFLNDDAVVSPGYVTRLVEVLEGEPKAASAVGKLVYRDEAGTRRIDSAGIAMTFFALRPDDRGRGEVDRGQYDAPAELFGPSGAAVLYRRAALESVGPEYFDEALFAYYEDVDLAWRLGRRGWTHLYVPDAVAEHTRRGPGEKPRAISRRAYFNRYLVWLKNESWWRFLSYGGVAVPWEIARLAKRAAQEPALLGGLLRVARLAPKMWAKR